MLFLTFLTLAHCGVTKDNTGKKAIPKVPRDYLPRSSDFEAAEDYEG